MRQRLGLAAALLTRPRLLVLDEPANGLDPAGTRHVHRVLTRLAAHGTAVVLSSHRMDDLAALCSEVTMLATGRVVFSGPLGELAADTDELDYRLRTSDPAAARRVAAETPGLRVLPDDDLLQRHDAEALLVRASVPALDELVARLVGAGVGVRELAPGRGAARGGLPGPDRGREEPKRGRGPVTTAAAITHADGPTRRRHPFGASYRFELVKLLAQWPVRLGAAGLLARPGAVRRDHQPAELAAVRHASSAAGWARPAGPGALVVLAFSCSWVLPLLTSLVAGDVFAAEDRLGTWRHLLVAVRSPRRIFAGQGAGRASPSSSLLAVGLAVSGIVGGLAAVGNRPLVGLDGHLLAPGHGGRSRSCSPGLGVLRADAGVRGGRPARLGRARPLADGAGDARRCSPCVLRIAQLLPLPVVVRVALPSYAFIAWRGLFTDPAQTGPLLVGIARQPRLGRRRDRAGLPAVHAPRLHRPGLRRRRPPRPRCARCCRWRRLLAVTVAVIAGRHVGLRLRDRQGQAGALARDGVRPPLPDADRAAAPPRRHRGAAAGQRHLRQGRLPGRRRRARATTGAAS